MQGNSLLEEYKGIKLIDERILEGSGEDKKNLKEELKSRQSKLQNEFIGLKTKNKLSKAKEKLLNDELIKIRDRLNKLSKSDSTSKEEDLFDADLESKKLFEKIKLLREEFFIESERNRKDKIKKEIEDIEWKFIETSLKEQNKESEIGELRKVIRSNKKPYFLWHFNFGEVFNEKGGFDVVIGNPPYGIVFDEILKTILEEKYNTFKRNNDIFVAFYEKTISLMNYNSQLSLITPNTFLNGDYFNELRRYFTQKIIINEIYDFKDSKIFQDPTVFVCIMSAYKIKLIKYPYKVDLKLIRDVFEKPISKNFIINFGSDIPFKPIDKIIQAITFRNETIALDSLFFVKDVGFNYWSVGKGKKRDGNSIGDRILYSGIKKNKLDKPYLKGRDVLKYCIGEPSHYLKHDFEKFLDPKVDIFRYSSNILETTPKIFYRQTSNRIISAIDYNGQLCDKSLHVIIPKKYDLSIDLKFLVALLNSSLFYYFYKDISQETEARTFAQVKTVYIKKLQLVNLQNNSQQKPFIHLVDQIIKITSDKRFFDNNQKVKRIEEIEFELDIMVFKLYNLTYNEVKIVDPEFTMSEREYSKFKI